MPIYKYYITRFLQYIKYNKLYHKEMNKEDDQNKGKFKEDR